MHKFILHLFINTITILIYFYIYTFLYLMEKCDILGIVQWTLQPITVGKKSMYKHLLVCKLV